MWKGTFFPAKIYASFEIFCKLWWIGISIWPWHSKIHPVLHLYFGKCGCTRNIIQFRERFRSLIQLQIQISSSSISQIILNASLNSNTLHSFTNKTDIFAFFPMGKCSDSLFLKPKCRNFLQIKSFAVNQIPTDMSATNVVFEWKPSITAFFWWF